MGDEEKSNRWTRTLGDAGLLDEIEDAWSLPEDGPLAGATIRVVGRQQQAVTSHSRVTPDVRAPYATPVPAKPTTAAGQGDQALPVGERTTLPAARSPTDEPPSLGLPTPPMPPPNEVAGWRRDSFAPAGKAGAARGDDPFEEQITPLVDLELVTPIQDEEPSVAVVEIMGQRITVPPTFDASDPAGLGTIWDEPPSEVELEEALAPPRPRFQADGEDPMAIVEEVSVRRDRRTEMRERFDIGDYSGALEVAEKILADDADDADAIRCKKTCRNTLMQMYESRIGSFDRRPMLAIPTEEILWRKLDAATGFVISRIDGMVTFEDVVDISGLSRFDTLRILSQLLQEGIIR